MGSLLDLPLQLQLRPSELPSGLDIPGSLLESQFRLQNYHVLCPADGHGLSQHLRCALVCAVKFPHPPQVPGRKARDVRVCAAQVLRRSHSRALLQPAADQPSNFAVQLHLGHV